MNGRRWTTFETCMKFTLRYSHRGFTKMSFNVRDRQTPAQRNKEPIKNTIEQYLKQNDDGQPRYMLEISSGYGVHVSYLAKHFPWITFQPTEYDVNSLGHINDSTHNIQNVKPAAYIDVRDPPSKWLDGTLAENSVDYILNVNMIHISARGCSEGLFYGCGKLLKPGQYLFTYGPYAFDGQIKPESNVQFNEHLKSMRPDWGLKDVKLQLEPLAAKNGMQLIGTYSLPANNHLLVWQKNK